MKPTFAKLDDNTLQITTTIVPQEIVSTYVYDDLVATLANLQAQKDAFNAAIDQRIADAQANVAAADSLSIVAMPVVASPSGVLTQGVAL